MDDTLPAATALPFEHTYARISIGTAAEMKRANEVFREVMRPTAQAGHGLQLPGEAFLVIGGNIADLLVGLQQQARVLDDS